MMSAGVPTSSQNEDVALLVGNLCQCQICLENFNETTKAAHMLHCGHTYCITCIKNIQEYGNSAHLECPACRSETKCRVEDIAPNFLVMEMIRNLKLMGPAETAPVKELKLARDAQRERTIDEMVDQEYRNLIAKIKGELMEQFEELRETMRQSTIQSVQMKLENHIDNVMDAVRDSYEGYSESECEQETEDDSESMKSVSTAHSISSSLVTDESTFVVRNPARSDNTSESSSSFSGEEDDDSESSDTDSNDGSNEMSEMTTEGMTSEEE